VRLTKRAINRSLDIGGMRQALLAALEIDVEIETHETAESREFNEIVQREGAKAAIAWRTGKTA
jgi:enoyl-CoA hydratase